MTESIGSFYTVFNQSAYKVGKRVAVIPSFCVGVGRVVCFGYHPKAHQTDAEVSMRPIVVRWYSTPKSATNAEDIISGHAMGSLQPLPFVTKRHAFTIGDLVSYKPMLTGVITTVGFVKEYHINVGHSLKEPIVVQFENSVSRWYKTFHPSRLVLLTYDDPTNGEQHGPQNVRPDRTQPDYAG